MREEGGRQTNTEHRPGWCGGYNGNSEENLKVDGGRRKGYEYREINWAREGGGLIRKCKRNGVWGGW